MLRHHRWAARAQCEEHQLLETFGAQVGNILNEKGPVFIAIKVIPEVDNEPIGRRQRRPTRNRTETIRDLQAELGITTTYK